MRRALLISISLVLALVAWSAACADDDFYVIAGTRGKYAPVPKTGQTIPYGTRDDGDLEKGVAWPSPRFTDNLNGTVTDNLTGLIWLKNANAFGTKNWAGALSAANYLASGSIPGLTDSSKVGDWRLPNLRELQSLVDYSRSGPALSLNYPFTGVQTSSRYWSSTSYVGYTGLAWEVDFMYGQLYFSEKVGAPDAPDYYVWPVRGGK